MYAPKDPRDEPSIDSSRSIAVSYGLIPLAFLSLWAVSQPLAGGVALAAALVLAVAVGQLSRLLRCFRACGGFTIEVGNRAQVSVTQPDCCRTA